MPHTQQNAADDSECFISVSIRLLCVTEWKAGRNSTATCKKTAAACLLACALPLLQSMRSSSLWLLAVKLQCTWMSYGTCLHGCTTGRTAMLSMLATAVRSCSKPYKHARPCRLDQHMLLSHLMHLPMWYTGSMPQRMSPISCMHTTPRSQLAISCCNTCAHNRT